MDLYVSFVDRVTEAVGTPPDCKQSFNEEIEHLLSTAASEELRRLVPREELRGGGVFFTPSSMAEHIWKAALPLLDESSIIVDPACGAGDLLMPPVRYLAKNGLDSELGSRIRGGDIEPNFVSAARARLRMALQLDSQQNTDDSFTHLTQRNFWDDPGSILGAATHVVINPPYTNVAAPDGCSWARGGVNAAALFVEACLREMEPGALLLAILPDVLRSGSRYGKWRQIVEGYSSEIRLEPLGQFDSQTDVHVFLMLARKIDFASPTASSRIDWNNRDPQVEATGNTVGDFFEVSVGPLVPHRAASDGEAVPTVSARDLPVWNSVNRVEKVRPFNGTLASGPFVVVRRTSRPGDAHRARATLVLDSRGIAVENHLLVLKPRDGSVALCRRLMGVLADDATTKYLDRRISCRHLTVGSVREIPWTQRGEGRNG